jgi:hypothetical protein
MANPVTQAYSQGNILVAGPVSTDQVKLVADTYYQGMPLKYEIDGTAAVVGTGNGTATDITAGPKVPAGAWTCTFTAALVFDLADPAGNIVGQFSVPNGGALDIDYNGLVFTITDGSTAWVATDVVTITIGTAGLFEYTSDLTETAAIFNGPTTVLASAGYGSVIKSGEVYEAGIVDDSGDALTLTEATRAALGVNGFDVRRTA